MKISISTYWKCQLIGWSVSSLFTNLFLASQNPGPTDFFKHVLIIVVFGLAGTHFLRFMIKQFKILNKTALVQIVYMLLLNALVGFFGTWFYIWVLDVTGTFDKNFRLSFFGEVIWAYHQTLTVTTAWTAIYFVVHYIRDVKKTEYEKAALRVRLAEMETQSLRAQMNPQFIFNSMNSIKSLITKNENDKAANYLTTFSKLIRTLFQNADKNEISLFEEIETDKLYTKLEQMRFGNKIDFVFNIDEAIDMKDIKVPVLLLQPFIENAIWYGLVPKENGGKIIVSINEKDGGLECVIDDDGIGRELSKQQKVQYEATHQSNRIGLTHTRLELDKLLNEREDSIQIIDKINGAGKADGTKVIITFKEIEN